MSEQATATSVVSSNPLVLRAVLRTDVGRVRSENQDFGSMTGAADEQRAHGRLLIVADGMGGHRGGATASRLAAETVQTQYLGAPADDIAASLREALKRANTKIFTESQSHEDLRGMGTTTSALAVRGNQAWFAHVGDSRIYLVRGDDIKQLTEDHSLVATMVREGLLTSKEAENHPRRNVLQRSIGVGEEVDIDVSGPFEVQELDTFVLCSDGLHGVVKPDEIKDMVLKASSIEEAADELVKRALERGGPDNVTVIVARAQRLGDEPTVVDRDRALYDDTMRENDKVEGHRSSVIGAETPKDPTTDDQRPTTLRAGSMAKWALIFILILATAGTWLFLNKQQMFANQNATAK